MKKKIGIVTAMVMATMACPFSAYATDAVNISAGTIGAEVGASFSIDISIDVPETGVQGMEFAVDYDESAITMQKCDYYGLDIANGKTEPKEFSYSINAEKGMMNCSFYTTNDDGTNWIKKSDAKITLTGTVKKDASAGNYAVSIKPIVREGNESVFAGYYDGDSLIQYPVTTTDGFVIVGGTVTGLRGDANCDASIDISDVVAIAGFVSNPTANSLTEQGIANADVQNIGDGISAGDALMVQQYLAGVIKAL